MKTEQEPHEWNEIIYFKYNLQNYTSTCSTVSPSDEYPAHKSPLTEIGTSFEHCLWFHCPSKNSDPWLSFSTHQKFDEQMIMWQCDHKVILAKSCTDSCPLRKHLCQFRTRVNDSAWCLYIAFIRRCTSGNSQKTNNPHTFYRRRWITTDCLPGNTLAQVPVHIMCFYTRTSHFYSRGHLFLHPSVPLYKVSLHSYKNKPNYNHCYVSIWSSLI